MAIPPINFNKFSQNNAIVDGQGRPTPAFLRWLNDTIGAVVYSFNQALAIPDVQQAIIAANAAAANAQAAADNAQAAGDANTAATALANSYPIGVTITATDAGANATITISSHNRVYATDPTTTVAVNGGVITGLAYDTVYFIYYDQPSRLGGAVTYVATTNQSLVAQINDRHSVGIVTTPLAGGAPEPGQKVTPPGGNYEVPL